MNVVIMTLTKFEFQNVGQGLFYTGKIDDFNFVYDCGSNSKIKYLQKAIENYKSNYLHEKIIDLLVISHFHQDHVNGLEELLKGIKVKCVIIPYYSQVERLVLALNGSNLPTWYYRFIQQPISYLLEKNVEKIILIRSRTIEYNISKYDIMSKKPLVINHKKILDYKDFSSNIESNQLIKYWKFKFFNYEIEKHILIDFKKHINENFKHTAISEIIVDKKSREKLRILYAKKFKNMNHTSLAMYHGPVNSDYSYHFYSSNKSLSSNKYILRNHIGNDFGHLLTGDINLNNNYTEFKNHFNDFTKYISFVQIPHHGSKYNWNSKILDDLLICKLWIIPAGVSTSHPHKKVILDLSTNGNLWSCNNEYNNIMIEGELI